MVGREMLKNSCCIGKKGRMALGNNSSRTENIVKGKGC